MSQTCWWWGAWEARAQISAHALGRTAAQLTRCFYYLMTFLLRPAERSHFTQSKQHCLTHYLVCFCRDRGAICETSPITTSLIFFFLSAQSLYKPSKSDQAVSCAPSGARASSVCTLPPRAIVITLARQSRVTLLSAKCEECSGLR